MNLQIEILDDDQWASLVATRFVDRLNTRPDARICLPTGDTPKPLYREMARRADLSAVTIFLLDEFTLPSGHAGRCDAMLKRDLLDLLETPPRRIEALDTLASDGETECRRFETLVDDGGLDLTLLGLGGNGHLGLNEPGSEQDSPTRMVELAASTTESAARYDPEAHPTAGMTLGIRSIMESREVWLLVTGSHKATILRRMVHDPIGPGLPASYLRRHPLLTIFADRSAAADL